METNGWLAQYAQQLANRTRSKLFNGERLITHLEDEKSVKIKLAMVKDPDAFGELIDALELDDEQQKRWFQWSEYADIELTFSLKENDLVCEGKVLNNGSSVSYKGNGS